MPLSPRGWEGRQEWSKSEDLPMLSVPPLSGEKPGSICEEKRPTSPCQGLPCQVFPRLSQVGLFAVCTSFFHLIGFWYFNPVSMKRLLFLANLLTFSALQAQTDSVRTLPAVDIVALRLQDFGIGHSLDQPDSVSLRLGGSLSVADVLLRQGIGQWRTYGPGGLASLSLDGSSSSQVNVTWEGIPLQSPMNGVADVAQLPTAFFDQVLVCPGANGALLGNSSMGGTLALSSLGSMAMDGWEGWLQAGAGQFGLNHLMAGIRFKRQVFSGKTVFFQRASANRFLYREPGESAPVQQEGAAFFQRAVQQQLSWQMGGGHRLTWTGWAGLFDRQLPPTASQGDLFARQVLQYAGQLGKIQVSARSGWTWDRLDYQDTVSSLDVTHNTRVAFHDLSMRRFVSKRDLMEISFQHQWALANSPQLEVGGRRIMPGALVSWRRSWSPRFSSVASLRKDWPRAEVSPWMPGLGLEGKISDQVRMFARLDRGYRLPTLNDRYWLPGGNRELLPESGWQGQLGAEGRFREVDYRLRLYRGRYDNWILWRPGASYWTPMNVREVLSQGAHLNLSRTWDWGLNGLIVRANYQWTSSKTTASLVVADGAVGKQLIYLPEHSAFGSLRWTRGIWTVSYLHRWLGSRNITSDGAYHLPAVHLAQLDAQTEWETPLGRILAQAMIDNLWNQSYQLVQGQPMPLRNISFILTLLVP